MIETRLASLMSTGDADSVYGLIAEAIIGTKEYSLGVKNLEIDFHNKDFIIDKIDSGLCVVALKDGEICGTCFGENESGVIWLSWVAVTPSHQKIGVGEALLEKFIDVARGEGIRKPLGHKITCASLKFNMVSFKLLTKMGFQTTHFTLDHWHHLDFRFWEREL